MLSEGRVAFAAWCTLADPAIVEMIGLAGYDCCFIDMEHTATDIRLLEHMCRAADTVGVTPIVRVSDDNPKGILRVLECGAQGVIVPHVMSGADAARLVEAVRYPPLGKRGISFSSRAGQYTFASADDHIRDANRELMLIALIEDREAVEDIEAILTTPGLDAAFIAPADLAASLGHPTEPNHPDTIGAAEKIVETARRKGGVTLGCNASHRMYTKSVPELIALGIRFILVAQDCALLAQAFKHNVESLAEYRI